MLNHPLSASGTNYLSNVDDSVWEVLW